MRRYGWFGAPAMPGKGAPMLPHEGAVLPNTSFNPSFSPVLEMKNAAAAIATARTPKEAAIASKMPIDPATMPVLRNDAIPFPASLPPPAATDPSWPDGFPEYKIRPEIIGAPVNKGIVPGMYNEPTLISLFPGLTASKQVDKVPQVPEPVEPLSPPAPVKDIFNTKASEKIDQAIEMDHASGLQRDIAADLQRKADKAAYDADKAATAAAYNPTFDAQASAEAAAAKADNAQYLADRAQEKAAVIDQKADEKAVEANQATEQIVRAAEEQQYLYDTSVSDADAATLEEALSIPGMVPPEMLQQVTVPGFSVSPVIAGGALGLVGFLLGGARAGAVGALLGGAGAYFMGQRQQGSAIVATQFPPNPPAPLGPDYHHESFVPYEIESGVWITSQQEQDAWMAANVPPGGWPYDPSYPITS